jgi:ribonuclease BN (tRNA processing enzyme)
MTARIAMIALLAAIATAGWVVTFGAWRYQQVAAGIAFLEDRAFGNLTTIAVGTGGARENHDRLGPCIAIGGGKRILLVDAGRGTAEALRQAKIPVTQPTTVLLTSLLPENVQGLDDLLLTGWEAGRTEPIRVIGPAGTRALTAMLESAHTPGAHALGAAEGRAEPHPRFEALEIEDGWQKELDGIQVRAAALAGGPLAAFAYRFDAGPRSSVVTGVGWGRDALVALAKGADVLVVEALHGESIRQAIESGVADRARLERELALHLATDDVGGLAQRAGVHSVVLVRLRPPPLFAFQYERLVAKTFSGRIVVPDDGDEITR